MESCWVPDPGLPMMEMKDWVPCSRNFSATGQTRHISQWILEWELRSSWGRRERLVLWEYLTSRLHIYWGMKEVYQDNNDEKKMLKLRPSPPQMCRCQPDKAGDERVTLRRCARSHFYLRTSRWPSCPEQINSEQAQFMTSIKVFHPSPILKAIRL